jgi:hypothetical protein
MGWGHARLHARQTLPKAIGAAVCALTFSAAPVHAQATAEVAVKPPVKAGDRWVYQRHDLLKDKLIEKAEFAAAAVAGDAVDLRRTPLGADGKPEAAKAETFRFDWGRGIRTSVVESGNYRYFDFPLQPGKQWSYKYRRPSSGGGPSTDFDAKAEVKGWQEVTVPAGKFRSLLVRHAGEFKPTSGAGTGSYQMDVWYSPQVRRIVKEEFQGYVEGQISVKFRTELVEYQVAP